MLVYDCIDPSVFSGTETCGSLQIESVIVRVGELVIVISVAECRLLTRCLDRKHVISSNVVSCWGVTCQEESITEM